MDDPEGSREQGSELDRRLRMVSNRHRRRLLQELLGREPVGERELLSMLDSETDDAEVVVVQMYHHHLPMLADQGYVEWSRDEGTIRRGSGFDSLRPLLEYLSSEENDPRQ
jgi:hypothetical protein